MRSNLTTVALWAAALLPVIAFAQLEKSLHLQGEILGGPPGRYTMTVELSDLVKHMTMEAIVTPQGTFDFQGVPTGTYQIRVIGSNGNILRHEQITVSPSTGTVMVQVPSTPSDQPTGGTVSVSQLKHKVPGKARKAFAEAEKKNRAGDYAGSLLLLQQAVQIDPDYLEAQNNIGCRLLSLNRPEEALVALRRALEIDRDAPYTYGNIAAALLYLQRPAEAEAAARTAVNLDGGSLKDRYLLGMSLFQQRKFTREAAQNLRKAEKEFPRASLAAAAVLERMGEVGEAKQELMGYLSDSNAVKRTEVQAWLSRLK